MAPSRDDGGPGDKDRGTSKAAASLLDLEKDGAPSEFGSHLETLLDKPAKQKRRKILLLTLAACFALTVWFVPPVYKLVYGPVTVTRWDRKKGETRVVVGPGQKGWISTKKMSRHALHAAIAAEDGKFYEHHGFDFEEIAASVKTNLKRKRYARGGSTISQQVVKMAFLSREKSLLRKAREAVGTVLMEAMLPKDKILEWYINLAEFGDGVYGIEEGCWHYFKTKPELLSIEQSVHLALVLPSPNSWSRGLRARHLTPFGHRRFAAILNRMRQSGYITKAQWATAVTRGDFGRPIHGYAGLLAAEEEKKTLCPGNPGCPDTEDDGDSDEDPPEIGFPDADDVPAPTPAPAPAPATPDAPAEGVLVDPLSTTPESGESPAPSQTEALPPASPPPDGDAASAP